jgi:hypothetical protein
VITSLDSIRRAWGVVLSVVVLSACSVWGGDGAAPAPDSDSATALRPTSKKLSRELMDPNFAPRLGTYTYRFHWLLKTGAESTVKVERVGDDYHMTTTAATGWFVDRVYRVRYKGVAVLDAETLTPRRVELHEEIRSTRKHTVMEYADGELRATRVKRKKKRKPSERTYVQDTKGGQVLDYFSAVLIARAMAWAPGDVRTVEVFDGKGLSWAELTCVGKKRVKVRKRKIDTWKIRVRVVQGGEDLDEDDELIADDITLYLAADDSREIVRIEADTPFGNMKVILKKFVPAPEVDPADDAAVASRTR